MFEGVKKNLNKEWKSCFFTCLFSVYSLLWGGKKILEIEDQELKMAKKIITEQKIFIFINNVETQNKTKSKNRDNFFCNKNNDESDRWILDFLTFLGCLILFEKSNVGSLFADQIYGCVCVYVQVERSKSNISIIK